MDIVKEKIISWLKKLIKKLENNNESKDENLICNNENIYNVLLPKEELEEEKKIYIDLLEKAVKHKKIINIGITGTYGAGKSTVIKSFLKENSQYNSLSISLLNFLEENQSKNVTREALEKSILEQIFYSIKGENIPFSKFKRIIKLNKLKYFLLTISIICYIFIYFILKNNEKIKQIFIENKILEFFNLSASEMSMVFIFIVISIWWCYSLLIKINTIKFSKFGGEIELKKSCEIQNEKSILNNYLDEIIYCLEVAKIDIFIIEDLDRFNDKSIFINLKELNFIINNSKEIKNKITFIYAVKDDLFENSERSKFFDFIIPIVPILNSANSDGALLSKIKDKNIFTEGFLEDIFLYIHDMRLGLNIINEFNLYFSIFEKQKYNLENSRKEKNDKLLAIIVYKNIFPSEFSKLNFNNGELYDIFNYRKNKIIEILIEKKEKELTENEEYLETINKEHFSIDELKIFYCLAILKENTNDFNYNNRWNSPNSKYSRMELIDMFDYFYEKNGIEWRYSGYSSFKDVSKRIEMEYNMSISYEERIKILEKKEETNKLEIINQIKKIKNEIITIKKKSLKELIKNIGTKEKNNLILGPNENEINLKNEYKYKVKAFLIFNGYIDEYYFDYTSFIYPGALNEKDIKFLEKVSAQMEETENLPIHNYCKVLERLRNINSKYMLNYNLIRYAERNKEFELDYFRFIEYMALNYKESYEFVYNLIKEIKDRKKFFSKFVEYNNEIWKNILEIRVNINEYLVYFIEYLTIKEMENINNASQNKFIENLQNFKNILQQNLTYEKLDEIYKKFKIKFNFLSSHEDARKEIVDCIINNEMFEITRKNLENIYWTEKKEKLVSEELLTLLKEKSPKIWSYILSNSKIFLNEVYVNLESHKSENVEYVIEILETLNYNEQHEKELLQNLIETDLPIIDDIKIINNEVLRRSLVLGNKIRKNYNNLKEFVEIYQKENYYDQTIKELFLSNIEDYEPEIISEGEKLFQDILNSEIIDSECFIRVLNVFDVEKITVLVENDNEIYREKLKYLISKNKIEYSEENFLLLSDILLETKEYVKFIEDNLEKITKLENKDSKEENQIIEKFLFSPNINSELFQEILKRLDLQSDFDIIDFKSENDFMSSWFTENRTNEEKIKKIEYLVENNFFKFSDLNFQILKNFIFEKKLFIEFINKNLKEIFETLSSARKSEPKLIERVIVDSDMLESYKEVINFIKNDEFSKEIARKIIETSPFDFKINLEILIYLIKTHSEIFKKKLVEIIGQQIKFHTPDEIIHLADLVFPGIKKKQILISITAKYLLKKLKEDKVIQDFKIGRKYIYIVF